jgi:hypothetical protein
VTTSRTVNASVLARWLGGVSREYVGQLAKRNLLHRAPNGNYDLFENMVSYIKLRQQAANINPSDLTQVKSRRSNYVLSKSSFNSPRIAAILSTATGRW